MADAIPTGADPSPTAAVSGPVGGAGLAGPEWTLVVAAVDIGQFVVTTLP